MHVESGFLPLQQPAWLRLGGLSHFIAMSHRKQDHRPSARRRGYGAAWQRESKDFLALPGNRICRHCRVRPATLVDHRRAHKGDMQLFWDRTNWVPSCGPCNSRKAAMSEGGFGNRKREFTPRVKGCDASGWPLDPRSHWCKER